VERDKNIHWQYHLSGELDVERNVGHHIDANSKMCTDINIIEVSICSSPRIRRLKILSIKKVREKGKGSSIPIEFTISRNSEKATCGN
jgi:hypothetical protein